MNLRFIQEPPSNRSTMFGAFAHPAFAIVWTASTCALIGIAMYDTASGWLMTTFDLNPFDVSLLHTATTLPIFLFTLPAGAIADIVDPRRMIIAVSFAIAALMTIFAAVVALEFVSPALLLLTTFVLSAAWSLNAPAWLSIVPQLVPKPMIPGAIAAHSVGYNLSRTLGPALGGFIIVRYGAAVPLWIFVGANLAVIAALTWWRAPGRQRASLPAERLSSALRTGLRHTANNRLLWATLARTIAIYPFTAAYWGLLPLIARRTGQGAEHYGILLSAISVGAILGSLGHEKFRRKFGADRLVAAGTILTVVRADAVRPRPRPSDFALRLPAGRGGVGQQPDLPLHLRTECLARLGARPWARRVSDRHLWDNDFVQRGLGRGRREIRTFGRAAHRRRRRDGCDSPHLGMEAQQGALDLSPSQHWSLPETRKEIDNDRGPVLVKIEYRIDPKDSVAFVRALDQLGFERRRDGAFAWGIFEDASDLGRYEEAYLIESSLELMHLRERVTNADRVLEDEIREMLIAPPRIEFLIAAERGDQARNRRAEPAGA